MAYTIYLYICKVARYFFFTWHKKGIPNEVKRGHSARVLECNMEDGDLLMLKPGGHMFKGWCIQIKMDVAHILWWTHGS